MFREGIADLFIGALWNTLAVFVFPLPLVVQLKEPYMAVQTVTGKQDFDTIFNSSGNKLVVLFVSAAWNDPGNKIKPDVEKFSNEFTDCSFWSADVDEVGDDFEAYGLNVDVLPAFFFLKSGKIINQFAGADSAKLRQLIVQNR
jgi:thioredoxin-like negative regulator of GroEL